mmetsp:Transcript_49889/g.83081  ORF Transcript_49889/g.83081 Transcript_49889/m.83081 type:complete len:422 (+) Transcript_49889:30-1295(+)
MSTDSGCVVDAGEAKSDAEIELSKYKDSDFYNANDRIELGVNFYVNRMADISLTNETFFAHFDLELQWRATREELNRFKAAPKNYEPDYIPNFFVMNGDCSKELQTKEGNSGYRVVVEGDKDSWGSLIGKCRYPVFNLVHYKMQGSLRESFKLNSFPFDCQDLQITLELAEKVDEVMFVPSYKLFLGDYCGYLGMAYSTLDEYVVHEPLMEFILNEYADTMSCVTYRGKVERKYGTYFGKLVVFVFILTACALLTFSMDPVHDLPDRYAFMVTLLLTAVAFQFVVTSEMPNLPYLTLLDQYILVSFLFLAWVLVCCCVLALVPDSDAFVIEEINLYLFALSAFVFLLYHVVFTVVSYRANRVEVRKLKYTKYELEKDQQLKALDQTDSENKSVRFSKLFVDPKLKELLPAEGDYDNIPVKK